MAPINQFSEILTDCPGGVWRMGCMFHEAKGKSQSDRMLLFTLTRTLQLKERLLPTPSAVHFYPALIQHHRDHIVTGHYAQSVSLTYAVCVEQEYTPTADVTVSVRWFTLCSQHVALVPMTIAKSTCILRLSHRHEP